MRLLALALPFLLSGCASLYWAGASEYQIQPLMDGDKLIGCCSLTVHSGKQYASVDATFAKTGNDYKITLNETRVQAFKGQAIAAAAASDAVAAGVSAVGTAASTAVKLSTGVP